jgi:ATP-dependent helicase HrpA
VSITGYPALVDQRESVGVRIFDTREAADRSHRHGLARLIMLAYPDEMRYQRDHLPGFDELAIYAAELNLESTNEFRDQLMLRIIEQAFLPHGADIRTGHEFDRAIEAGWHHSDSVIERTCSLLRQILELHHHLAMELSTLDAPQFAEPVAEIEEQLAHLLHGRFLRETPQQWLEQYPRYLKAVRSRIDKLTGGRIGRDRELAGQFEPLWRAYLDLIQQHRAQGRFDSELERYRWMLEEYHVALFAQELGTTVKVSPKRLEEQWAQVRR